MKKTIFSCIAASAILETVIAGGLTYRSRIIGPMDMPLQITLQANDFISISNFVEQKGDIVKRRPTL
jgi:hypothetical protein